MSGIVERRIISLSTEEGDRLPTLIPPMRCSPLNSRPFLSHLMLGMGLPIAGQRNFTVFPAGTAYSFFSMRWTCVQYGPVDRQDVLS